METFLNCLLRSEDKNGFLSAENGIRCDIHVQFAILSNGENADAVFFADVKLENGFSGPF